MSFIDVADGDARTLRRQTIADRRTDTAPATRHDGDGVLKSRHFSFPSETG